MLRDERGAQTVEFVLWVPIIVALVVIMVDAATLYITHTEMWNVARDTARRMVTGKILTEADAEAYALDAMSLRDWPYAVEADYDESGVVQFLMALEVGDISIIGYGSPLTIFGGTVRARVVMRPDPRIPFQTGAS